MKREKRKRAPFDIKDSYGEVLYRAYVDDPAQGLRNAELEGFVVPDGQMQGLDMSGAHLYWATMFDADLSFANLSGADLRGANLNNAVCKGTNFRNANFGRDNLNGRTTLRGTNLDTALLDGANFIDAVYDETTTFPEGFSPEAEKMTHVDELGPEESRRRK